MAFHDIAFSFGQTLTHSLMNQMQENFTSFAADASGSPQFLGRADSMVIYNQAGVFLL